MDMLLSEIVQLGLYSGLKLRLIDVLFPKFKVILFDILNTHFFSQHKL